MFSLYLYLNFFPCIEIKHDKARGQGSSCPLSLLSWIYYYSNHYRTRRTRFSTGQVLMRFISLSRDRVLLCSPGGWPQNWQCFRSSLSHAGSTWNCVLLLDFSSVCVWGRCTRGQKALDPCGAGVTGSYEALDSTSGPLQGQH